MLRLPFAPILALAIGGSGSHACAQAMSFKLETGDANCRECRRIVAQGEIEADTAAKLDAFATANALFPEDVVTLNSPGGSLLGGMDLGRAIRSLDLATHVGTLGVAPDTKTTDCASACAYAFLGGVNRSVADDGRLGLHRFLVATDRAVSARVAVEGTQSVLSDVLRYVEEMGVSKDYAAIATATASDEITWPPYAALVSLKAVNVAAPYAVPEWALLARTSSVLAVRTVRNNGSLDHLMLECSIGFRKRPVKLIYGHEAPKLVPSTARTAFEVEAAIVGSSGQALKGTEAFPNKPVFSRSGQSFHISFLLDADDLQDLAKRSETARLQFIGDAKFSEAFGATTTAFPLKNLAALLESELELCR